MNSSIPLLGMNHRVDFVRCPKTDDGYGGIVNGSSVEVLVANVKCRATQLTAMQEQDGFGNTSGDRWQIISAPVTTPEMGDFVRVTSGSAKTLMDRTILYEIVHIKNQIDHNGLTHHTMLIVHKTPTDSLNV